MRLSQLQRDYDYDILQKIIEDPNGRLLFELSPDGLDNELISADAANTIVLKELYQLIQDRLHSFQGKNVVVSVSLLLCHHP